MLNPNKVFSSKYTPRAIIEDNRSTAQWSLLAKMKIGILSLAIEMGRWEDSHSEKRLCGAFSERVLEKEYHFLLFCDRYRDLRTQLFQERNEIHVLDLSGSQKIIIRTIFM